MVALEAATLSRCENCYDLELFRFNLFRLQEKIVILEQNFSAEFVNLIKDMLVMNQDSRTDVFSLWESYFLFDGRQTPASKLTPGRIRKNSKSKSKDINFKKEVIQTPERIPRRVR
jgi:hypothetical protein